MCANINDWHGLNFPLLCPPLVQVDLGQVRGSLLKINEILPKQKMIH